MVSRLVRRLPRPVGTGPERDLQAVRLGRRSTWRRAARRSPPRPATSTRRSAPAARCISHGILSFPPGGDDFFGLYEVPGGIKGVVDVSRRTTSSTRRRPRARATATTAPATVPSASRLSDAHQPFGVGLAGSAGLLQQLRKANRRRGPGRLPEVQPADRRPRRLGGLAVHGRRLVRLGTTIRAEASRRRTDSPRGRTSRITSNVALVIPCVIFDGTSADPPTRTSYYGVPTRTGFDHDQCYSAIQGTSMAAPTSPPMLALIAERASGARGPAGEAGQVPEVPAVTPIKSLTNTTPPLSATDVSNTDLTGDGVPRRLLPPGREGDQGQGGLRRRARERCKGGRRRSSRAVSPTARGGSESLS